MITIQLNNIFWFLKHSKFRSSHTELETSAITNLNLLYSLLFLLRIILEQSDLIDSNVAFFYEDHIYVVLFIRGIQTFSVQKTRNLKCFHMNSFEFLLIYAKMYTTIIISKFYFFDMQFDMHCIVTYYCVKFSNKLFVKVNYIVLHDICLCLNYLNF